jgi:hypothetical protein
VTAGEAAALRERAERGLRDSTDARKAVALRSAEAAKEQAEAIRAAHAAGLRPREIGAVTGLSRQRIHEIVKEER